MSNIQNVSGRLFILPYSGWAEVHSESGISVFWFSSDVVLTLAPYINEVVLVYYDDSVVATRKMFVLGKQQDVPRLVNLNELFGKKTLSKEMRTVLSPLPKYHHPRCWSTVCDKHAIKGSAYCENHTPR